jgi:hypothetical protein
MQPKLFEIEYRKCFIIKGLTGFDSKDNGYVSMQVQASTTSIRDAKQ